MNDGRPPERWCFILDIRAEGAVSPAIIARRLLKHILRRWGIKCKGLLIDQRMFDLTEENKHLRKIIDSLAERCAKQSDLLSRAAEKKEASLTRQPQPPVRATGGP